MAVASRPRVTTSRAELAQRRQAGLALVQKYGRLYMRRIGVRGGRPRIQEIIKRQLGANIASGAEKRGKGQSNPRLTAEE